MTRPIIFTNLEPEPADKMRAALDAMGKASTRLDVIDRQLRPLNEKRKRLVETLHREIQNFYHAIGKENPYVPSSSTD